jgi:hypothetical protein
VETDFQAREEELQVPPASPQETGQQARAEAEEVTVQAGFPVETEERATFLVIALGLAEAEAAAVVVAVMVERARFMVVAAVTVL